MNIYSRGRGSRDLSGHAFSTILEEDSYSYTNSNTFKIKSF